MTLGALESRSEAWGKIRLVNEIDEAAERAQVLAQEADVYTLPDQTVLAECAGNPFFWWEIGRTVHEARFRLCGRISAQLIKGGHRG